MPNYTIEVAQTHLDSWLAAELALSTGQSYTLGTRSLTRVDLKSVMLQIKYWQKQVDEINRCELGMPARSRVRQYVPYDL